MNRIKWIDNAKGISMLCVIAQHSGHAPVWMVKTYVPLFLSTFFFISGYLFINPDKTVALRQKGLNLCTSLLLPYGIYCVLTYIYNLFTGGYEALVYDLEISLLGLKSWFISALIVTELFGLGIFVIYKKYGIGPCLILPVLFGVAFFCLPAQTYYWNFSNAMFAGVYFSLGILCRYFRFTDYFLKNRVGYVLLTLYVIFVLSDIMLDLNSGNFNETFTNYPFFIVETLVGIPAFVWLCSKLRRYNQLILFIGANSLLYYYFQSVCIRSVCALMAKFDLHLPDDMDLVVNMIIVTFTISVAVIVINRYFPMFSGKYRINLKSYVPQTEI